MLRSCNNQGNDSSDDRPTAANQQYALNTDADRHFVIPVFLPHLGCPHHCVFCNQRAITRAESVLPSPDQLRRTVETYLTYPGKRSSRIQIAFYGGNFLGLDPAVIRSLLSVAEDFVTAGGVDGIRFSTRPDTIDSRRLEMIAPFRIQTVELGVQSMQPAVLQKSGRGHSVDDTITAVRRLGQRAYEIGLQLMLGLPGDTLAGCFDSARQAADLRPDFVRLYPAVVLAGSRMAAWYHAGEYTPMSLSECVQRVKHLVLFFRRRKIRIVRMGLQASGSPGIENQVLAGPYHPAFGHLVHCELFFDMARRLISSSAADTSAITFAVHPRSVPRIRGLRNENLMRLRNEWAIDDLQIRPDPRLPVEALRLAGSVKMLTYADLQCDI